MRMNIENKSIDRKDIWVTFPFEKIRNFFWVTIIGILLYSPVIANSKEKLNQDNISSFPDVIISKYIDQKEFNKSLTIALDILNTYWKKNWLNSSMIEDVMAKRIDNKWWLEVMSWFQWQMTFHNLNELWNTTCSPLWSGDISLYFDWKIDGFIATFIHEIIHNINCDNDTNIVLPSSFMEEFITEIITRKIMLDYYWYNNSITLEWDKLIWKWLNTGYWYWFYFDWLSSMFNKIIYIFNYYNVSKKYLQWRSEGMLYIKEILWEDLLRALDIYYNNLFLDDWFSYEDKKAIYYNIDSKYANKLDEIIFKIKSK